MYMYLLYVLLFIIFIFVFILYYICNKVIYVDIVIKFGKNKYYILMVEFFR